MGKVREITAETLFWAGLGFKVLAALKKRKDENAAKVGALKKNATFAANHKTQTAMREQESTGRQIAKIGRPRNVFDELQGHVGPDGRTYYDADDVFRYYDRRFAEVFGKSYHRIFND